MPSTGIKEEKMRIRKHVWEEMERHGIARFPRPVYGRIPNFEGAERAAARIIALDAWRSARVVKANPDSPQRHLRYHALREGKLLVMATPRLRQGFLLLDPRRMPGGETWYASSIRGAFRYGRLVELDELPSIDLVVTGCVAVDRRGHRLGKGGGYADLEYGLLRELGLVTEETLVVTTIHDIQLVENIPREPFDLTVDIAATPRRLYVFEPRPPKPHGIYWDMLGEKAELGVIIELKKLLETRGKA